MGLYDTTIGAILVGIFFNTFLYGLVTYQFAAYYRTNFNDLPIIKYMVLFLFILDTFQSSSVIYLAWYYTVTNYGNPASLEEPVIWPNQFTPIGNALCALATQIYLGFRIWRLTKSKVLYGMVIVLAILSFVLGVVCGIEAYVLKVLSEFRHITPLVITSSVMQVIADAFITITLTVVLYRSRTGFRKTDTIINRLIRGAIQTGLFTGIFSLCSLVFFILLPDMNFYTMFAIPIGRIYTNTLMDTLLSRASLIDSVDAGHLLTSHISIIDLS